MSARLTANAVGTGFAWALDAVFCVAPECPVKPVRLSTLHLYIKRKTVAMSDATITPIRPGRGYKPRMQDRADGHRVERRSLRLCLANGGSYRPCPHYGAMWGEWSGGDCRGYSAAVLLPMPVPSLAVVDDAAGAELVRGRQFWNNDPRPEP